MKIFNRIHYKFLGPCIVQESSDSLFYAFQCIKSNFSPEIVIAKEAKLIYPNGGTVYFDADSAYVDGSSLCLKKGCHWDRDLAENESKWCERRPHSKVASLTERPLTLTFPAARRVDTGEYTTREYMG